MTTETKTKNKTELKREKQNVHGVAGGLFQVRSKNKERVLSWRWKQKQKQKPKTKIKAVSNSNSNENIKMYTALLAYFRFGGPSLSPRMRLVRASPWLSKCCGTLSRPTSGALTGCSRRPWERLSRSTQHPSCSPLGWAATGSKRSTAWFRISIPV